MARGLAVVIAVTCVLVQALEGDAFSDRDRRRRLASAEWVWDSSSNEVAAAAAARLLHNRLRPEADDSALLAYLSGVLSAVCCNAKQAFDIGSKTCRRVADRSEPLLLRSGLTTLPPNCPPPTKYDPESKRCRDVWD